MFFDNIHYTVYNIFMVLFFATQKNLLRKIKGIFILDCANQLPIYITRPFIVLCLPCRGLLVLGQSPCNNCKDIMKTVSYPKENTTTMVIGTVHFLSRRYLNIRRLIVTTFFFLSSFFFLLKTFWGFFWNVVFFFNLEQK